MLTRVIAAVAFVSLCVAGTARAQSPQVGAEFDVLPYATGGWYVSGWWGTGHVRLRAVASDIDLPDFTISGDFKDGKSRAYAGLIDYFPKSALRGPWIGAGVEHWRNQIGHPAETERGEYTTWMATVGGGWIFNLGRHVYLNPWAAGHVRMSGDHSVRVGSRVYAPPKGLGEVSIKLGLRF
jgi:hypothetical protein